jgi:hypothetical protein
MGCGFSAHNVTTTQTLITHWNDTSWAQVPSPNPGGTASGRRNVLYSVSAASSSNAWAVGSYFNGTTGGPLILHWNGTAWKQQTSPDQGELFSVAATSSSSAWAAGLYPAGPTNKTRVERWNGAAWKQQPSPSPAGFRFGSQLSGVTATSPSSAWAAGSSFKDIGPTIGQTLILHWNGTAWAQVPSPNPGGSTGSSLLGSVYALSSSTAWAVEGYTTSPTTSGHTLVVHWNGTAWKQQASP